MSSVQTPTNDATPTLKGEVGTASGDEHVVNVTVYEGASVGGGVASSGSAAISGSSWTYTSSKLKDGTYTAEANQSDAPGNVGKNQARTFNVKTYTRTANL